MTKLKQKYEKQVEKDFKQFSEADKERINKAYLFSKNAHGDQKRASGEDYFIHPYSVSIILRDLNMDADTIIAGILHDSIEDTKCTKKEIKQNFGSTVSYLVEAVTNLGKVDFGDIGNYNEILEEKRLRKIEGLRKLFLAMSGDLRVVIIKLADRLNNMRTLEFLPIKDQRRIAEETIEIFAPLANRLGMGEIKAELEDLSFKYWLPEEYKEVIKKTKGAFKDKEKCIKEMEYLIGNELKNEKIKYKIESRAKHYYSIYKKLKKTDDDISTIYDLMALRIIVPQVEDCYRVLGKIHSQFKPLIYRIKDYIALPKPNGYRSLHTTVFGIFGRIFEVQIRTMEMHEEAEKGVAAHWFYDESKKSTYKNNQASFAPAKETLWVNELLTWQEEAKGQEEFMEGLKIDIFKDRIFVFTPHGDIFDLPEGATPIDFAYAVHSEVGEKAIGAKINGKIIPIDGKLENRDIVEIITSNSSGGPKRDWLSFVVTSKAKQNIRSFLKKINRNENIKTGKNDLTEELEELGFSEKNITSKKIKLATEKLPYKTLDDLYAAIGEGALSAKKVANLILPVKKESVEKDKEPILSKKPKKEVLVEVMGESDLLVSIASCCNPLPDNPIKGYITQGKGITIHKKTCKNIMNASKEKIVDANWVDKKNKEFFASYEIVFEDRVGLLRDVSSAISAVGLNILNINMVDSKKKTVTIYLKMSGLKREQFLSLERRLILVNGIIDFKVVK